MTIATEVMLAIAALSCATMGGIYFAFSAFIMRALADASDAGAVAMRSVNLVILRSAFMPFFFGSTLLAAILVVIGIADFNRASTSDWTMIMAGTVYVLGMFGTTVIGNVPLNDQLANDRRRTTWTDYLERWTPLNHLRTGASFLASVGFLAALLHAHAPTG
ncbi:anthrone oxygenase family protein [Devosia sediminis]|uniref:DUF1772 domain-containing protein n=1 Tax=Devosia sediminis TaxID=2798801 RepID=A0A934IVJ6_9HYPH|nr:anthrone oxygenase family protein [Devosia sediminis]MBJ3783896.1 DUF1772 domain-containing protein [Devosia sediminis]